MTKKLVVPMLALGLALFGGCGSSSSSNTGGSGGATGGAGGSTGGSGGSTGGSGGATGGSGGSTGGSGGSTGGAGGSTADAGTTDGSTSDATASDATAGDTAVTADMGNNAAVDWTMCGTGGSKPGVSAMDFCTRYMTVCTFDMTGGTAMMERYKNMGECISQYNALPTTDPAKGQACAAYHLCVAGTAPDTNKALHCPHPPEASLSPAAGPCK